MARFPSRRFVLVALLALSSCKGSTEASQQEPSSNAGESVEEQTPQEDPAPQRPSLYAGSELSAEEEATLGGLETFVSDAYLLEFVATHDSIDWFGFYIGGNKAGYAKLELRKTEAEEPGDFHVGLAVHLLADGESLEHKSLSYFEGKPPFRSVLLRTVESNSTGTTVHSFIRDGDRTRVESVLDGEKKPITWAPEVCDTLAGMIVEFAPDLEVVNMQSKARVCSFSDEEAKQEITELRVDSVGNRLVGGVELRVATLASRSGDAKNWVLVTLAGTGTAIEISIGEGLALKLEDKQVAQSMVVGVDINSLAVKVDRVLPNPSTIKSLTLKAHFAEGFEPPPSSPNQVVEKLADNLYKMTIRSIPGARVLASEREDALRPTIEVDSGDAAVVAKAKEVTVGATSNKEKVAMLNHWVYANLDKSLSTNLATASQVLKHKTGDCTEHTILLLALLRSLGIPARELSGLVYLDGEFSAFGWHAWTEVEIDGHWVQVDPSWDEVVGNATHLSLGVEDGSMNMGTIKLEVL